MGRRGIWIADLRHENAWSQQPEEQRDKPGETGNESVEPLQGVPRNGSEELFGEVVHCNGD